MNEINIFLTDLSNTRDLLFKTVEEVREEKNSKSKFIEKRGKRKGSVKYKEV